jgi:hypothetical protein
MVPCADGLSGSGRGRTTIGAIRRTRPENIPDSLTLGSLPRNGERTRMERGAVPYAFRTRAHGDRRLRHPASSHDVSRRAVLGISICPAIRLLRNGLTPSLLRNTVSLVVRQASPVPGDIGCWRDSSAQRGTCGRCEVPVYLNNEPSIAHAAQAEACIRICMSIMPVIAHLGAVYPDLNFRCGGNAA